MDFLQVYRSVHTQNLTALLGRFKKRWRTCARNRWRATCNIQECLRMHTWRIQVQFGNTRRPNLNRIFQMYIEWKSWFRLFGMCWSVFGGGSCGRLQVRAVVGDVVSCGWFLGTTLLSQLALSFLQTFVWKGTGPFHPISFWNQSLKVSLKFTYLRAGSKNTLGKEPKLILTLKVKFEQIWSYDTCQKISLNCIPRSGVSPGKTKGIFFQRFK